MKIFLIDDEESIRIGIGDDLRALGHDVYDFESPVTVFDKIAHEDPDCIFCDLRMPVMNGLDVLKKVNREHPGIIFVVITAYGDVSSAVECIKAGAFDYITKPFAVDDLESVLKKMHSFVDLKKSNRMLKRALKEKFNFHNIIGKSDAMKKVFQQIEVIARSDGTVVVQGETGTGKELVAQAIHYNSNRKNGPLIKCTCSIFSKELLESELFGHEQGAFTGAIRQKKGRFELANKGTVFLDEIDDVPMESQVKLLQFIQEKSYERVGGESTLSTDVRIIAATKVNLNKLIESHQFRSDLYYRLNVLPIYLPPLRERKDDVPLLINHFFEKFSPEKSVELSPEAVQMLCDYAWPGNVRQLENVIERLALTASESLITVGHLPEEITKTSGNAVSVNYNLSFEQVMRDTERNLLQKALVDTDGNKKLAAKKLNLPYSTYRNKLDKLNIS
ncbi:MAG: sigma-54-dependent Fis family transcriptional regulator [Fibrobacteria bacterium]|nr:sigma-54-dependent Fis family transcriptional regulator [Fibrobacteria bacterium]